MDESRHTYECVRPIFLPLRVLHISLKEPKMFLQQWMSEGTRTNEACPQIWICHVTHVDGSRHAHKCVTWTWSSCVPFHIWRSLFTYTRHFSHLHNVPSAWRTDVRDMTHSYVDKSRHTRERVSSKKKKKESRYTHMNGSRHAHEWMAKSVTLSHLSDETLSHLCDKTLWMSHIGNSKSLVTQMWKSPTLRQPLLGSPMWLIQRVSSPKWMSHTGPPSNG